MAKKNKNTLLYAGLGMAAALLLFKKKDSSMEGLGAVYSIELPLKTEARNGFRWKKNGNYRLRYNPYINAYQVFEIGDVRGSKIKEFNIYTNNENIGVEIVHFLQEKYGKGYGTISYENTTYGF